MSRSRARESEREARASDFSPFSWALTLSHAIQTDAEIYETARDLLRKDWQAGHVDPLDGARHERMNKTLHAADKLGDKYGEGSVSLALGMKGRFKERTHDALPNDAKPKK